MYWGVSFQRTGAETEKALAPVFFPIFQPFLTKTALSADLRALRGLEGVIIAKRYAGALLCRAFNDSRLSLNFILYSTLSQCSVRSKGVDQLKGYFYDVGEEISMFWIECVKYHNTRDSEHTDLPSHIIT